MKLGQAREGYYSYTGKLSDIVRQLSFAGIAVVWIFKTGEKSAAGIIWSSFLLWPLALFVLSLTFDLLHYAYASAAWGIFHRRNEIKILEAGENPEKDIKAPSWINLPSNIFFWLKVTACFFGHVFLLKYLVSILLK